MAAKSSARRSIWKVKELVLDFWLPALLVAVWWQVSDRLGSFYFPPLAGILVRFRELWLFSEVPHSLLPSLRNFGIGLTVGLAMALLLGVILGLLPSVYEAASPLLEFMRATPVITLLPLAIIIFGTGVLEKVVIISIATFWPTFVNTVDGVRNVEPMIPTVAHSFRIRWATLVFRMILPAASPQILTGVRLSISVAVVAMVGSELLAASQGVGYFLWYTQQESAITDMWTGVILLGILGYVINAGYALIEHRLLAWHRGMRATAGGASG